MTFVSPFSTWSVLFQLSSMIHTGDHVNGDGPPPARTHTRARPVRASPTRWTSVPRISRSQGLHHGRILLIQIKWENNANNVYDCSSAYYDPDVAIPFLCLTAVLGSQLFHPHCHREETGCRSLTPCILQAAAR